MDTVRGHDTWHTLFQLERRHSVLSRQRPLRGVVRHAVRSRRSATWQDIDEGSYEPKRHFEIFPDRREYIENDKPPQESVEHPLDDGSFSVLPAHASAARRAWTRRSTTTSRPSEIRFASRCCAARRSRCPAGKFNAIVVQPIIKSKGIFTEGGDARDLAFGRRQPHHAADEVEGELRIPQPLPQIVPPLSDDERPAEPRPEAGPAALTPRGGSLRRSHDSGRAAAEQGERRRVRASARATIVRSPHSSMRCPTCSSRATSARSSTRSCTRRRAKRGVVAMLGGHVVKTGLAPLLIDLMRRGVVTHVAMNGSAAIHDYEMARFGATSEDVAAGLRDGTFGMADETGREMNDAFVARHEVPARAWAKRSAARSMRARDLAAPELSILLNAFRLGVTVTVHAALGAEIIHQHPAANGAAIGDTSHRDFRRLAAALVRHRRRRRRAQPRQRRDHAGGVSQGADDRAQSERRPPAEFRARSISTCSATTDRG